MHTTTHDNLLVCHLTEERHRQTCGYYYTVTSQGMAHTAFRTRHGLDRWLADRGMVISGDISEPGTFARITGSYRTASYLDDAQVLHELIGTITPVMSNGDWTLGKITRDADGITTVHHYNPNVRTRPVLDYRTTMNAMDGNAI